MVRGLTQKVTEWIRRNRAFRCAAQYLYLKMSLLTAFCEETDERLFLQSGFKAGHENRTRIAFICDEMTWQDFHPYSDSVFLHPKIWKKQLEEIQPEILFCESAWSGIDGYRNVWRGRVYRDTRVPFENRQILLDVLKYCKDKNIVTVFWNKEDPTYFNHAIYNFTDTALRFDHVFTTAAECIERYEKYGHESVHLLPFGVNLSNFYPAKEKSGINSALFAGSWFGDHPGRCADLEMLLDYALAKGWTLDIYDRYSGSTEEKYRFPSKYAPYLHPAVPFARIPELCRRYQYAINVNTVVNSPTMISRRVLQLAACGVTIVSNDSQGFDALRDCLRIWRELPDGPVYAEGIPQALVSHSTEKRLLYIMQTVAEQHRLSVPR